MIDRRVQVLRAVATRGTITAAAEALGYTPSAVSHQLRGLARELGVQLLEPAGRGIRLTPAARVLLDGADDLNARWEHLRAELTAADNGHRDTLTLCGFSTAAAALLPIVAAALPLAHSCDNVRIIEASPEDCFDLLVSAEADAAVVVATSSTPPLSDPRFEQRWLLDDPLDLLVPVDHRLANRLSVSLNEASGERWILGRPGTAYRNLVLSACVNAGFTPFIAHESEEWNTGAALVGAGLGVAMVPRMTWLPEDGQIKRVPLSGEPAPARHILTATRRGSQSQPAIATALGILTAVARALPDIASAGQSPAVQRETLRAVANATARTLTGRSAAIVPGYPVTGREPQVSSVE